jgi:pimeloyl-ACP methyl ester carboxylesterase
MTVKSCAVDGAPISYTDTGTGPVMLFVHGVYVTGALWNDVVADLGEPFRCIVPTWPLGAQEPVGGDVDLGAQAAARRIVHFIETLDLHDVTIIANDTGGGLTLATLGDDTLDLSRIARLVLTNSDSYEHFPPGSFASIVKICRLSPLLGGAILRGLATGPGQAFFLKAVCRTPPAPARQAEIFGAFATNAATRPGGMYDKPTLSAQNCCRAWETSSGPLSMRSIFGGPPAAANTASSSVTSRSAVIERSTRCNSGSLHRDGNPRATTHGRAFRT